MLVARLGGGERIEAAEAVRGASFSCPGCGSPVVLRRGRLVLPHFAHRPHGAACGWAHGETLAHLRAKLRLGRLFRARGLRTETERVVEALPDDRRADLVVWSPHGRPVAVELQHSTIALEQIERRTAAYLGAGLPVVWIALLRPHFLEDAEPRPGGAAGNLFLARYAPPIWERWVHGYNLGALWFYDADADRFYRGRLRPHAISVPETRWRDGRETRYGGGYTRFSRRWRELTLWGPLPPERVRIVLGYRPESRRGWHFYPGGPMARLTVDALRSRVTCEQP